MHGVARGLTMGPPTRTASLVVCIIAMTFICQLALEADAGGKGKGKGRQGHIIIQNELKGNSVPIFMPVPIPIPVPMSPPQRPHSKPSHHEQQQQHNEEDAEGEVKKIYLLQPVDMGPRHSHHPPPHMKGGGFMGPPVQNHIHVSQMPMPARNHRPKERHSYDHSTAKSEVKILPIVVVPPVAPMPPIQVSPNLNHSPRMTLTPHFNNYVVTSSAGSARRKQELPQHRGGSSAITETFSEYGGSLGGSVFREQFSARSRPVHVSRPRERAQGWRHSPMRDFDYNDYDVPERTASDWGRDGGFRDSGSAWPPTVRAARQIRRSSGSTSRLRPRVTMNSINEIIDAYNRQQDGDGPINLDEQPSEYTAAHLRLTRVRERPPRPELSSMYGRGSSAESIQNRQGPASMEISLDDLAAISQESPRQMERLHKPDMGPPYYERAGDSPGGNGSPMEDYIGSGSQTMSADERGPVYDDDEWRFESIKSMSHTAPENNNGTAISAEISSSASSNTTSQQEGFIASSHNQPEVLRLAKQQPNITTTNELSMAGPQQLHRGIK